MPSPETVTIPLSTPIQAHGQTLSQLVLRRPTVRELRQSGAPYRIDGRSGGVAPDYEACAQLIALICAIPPSSVDQLDAADFDDIALRLVGFTKPAPVEAPASGSGPAS